MENILISGNTNPGKRRKQNQDAFVFRQLWSAGKALLVVVDGVGGYTGGEKAAAIARDAIGQYMQLPSGDTLTMLREAVVFANNRIVEERKTDQLTSEMCCVLTAAVADTETGTVSFVHVGDTRLYRFRAGRLQKLTRDHSFVGIREDAGELSELEAMNHPQRHQIFREVGSAIHRLDDEDFMDTGIEDLIPGDLLMLCSDGLTDMITGQQINTLLSAAQPLEAKVNNLISLANEMGGYDNITVVLWQYPVQEPAQADSDALPVADTARSQHIAPLEDNTARKKTQPRKSMLLWAVAGLLLLALACVYFVPPGNKITLLPAPSVTVVDKAVTSDAPDSDQLVPFRRSTHAAVPKPNIEEQTDTLRITATLPYEWIKQYADSTGKTIVLLPAAKKYAKIAAIEINSPATQPGDTLVIRNLRFKDFETGINVVIPVILQTDNLVFENTKYPFRYPVKADSRNTAVLFMNKTMR